MYDHFPGGLRVTPNGPNAYFSPTYELRSETFCDTPAGIEVSFWTHKRTEAAEDEKADKHVS